MRVDVKIPGTVESYCVDERRVQREATDALWLETFLCGTLRAYAYADDGCGDTIKKIVAVRRFDPITSTDLEEKFLDAAGRLFFKGWQLGSEPEIQVPNLVSNHLTTGILNYINTTGRYASGINLFEKLRSKDPEVSSLLGRVLISADEEARAVNLLRDAIEDLPMDYSLLDCQAALLQKEGHLDWALKLAQQSVIAAPSEFGTWSRLAEIYVAQENWDLALLTLNSCPMFTYQDKDTPRMPEPARVVLPLDAALALDEFDDAVNGYSHELVHESLQKLSAGTYRGTFAKAYSLLTDITAKIGWDQLLRIRSQVFVMEDEYRNEKTQPAEPQQTTRSSSTTAVHQASPVVNGKSRAEDSEVGDDEKAEAPNSLSSPGNTGSTSAVAPLDDSTASLERPENTVASEEVKSGSDDHTPANSAFVQFQHKRLCERWLDNLFMVLYEDLRVYTIWRTEMARYKASLSDPNSNITYEKSAEEWELYGDLAQRLHHPDESIEAYQSCLRLRFSTKAMKAVVDAWKKQKKNRNVLQGLLRLIAWQHRWYSEFSPDLLRYVRELVQEEGKTKVQSMIRASDLPDDILKLTRHYVEICAAFGSGGSDA